MLRCLWSGSLVPAILPYPCSTMVSSREVTWYASCTTNSGGSVIRASRKLVAPAAQPPSYAKFAGTQAICDDISRLVGGFGSPRPFRSGKFQEAGSARLRAACYMRFVAVHAPPARCAPKDSCGTAQQQIPFSYVMRVVCLATCNVCDRTTCYLDVGHSGGSSTHILPPLSHPHLFIADGKIFFQDRSMEGFFFSFRPFFKNLCFCADHQGTDQAPTATTMQQRSAYRKHNKTA